MSAEPEAVFFCSNFLGVATSTVEFTFTPAFVVSETVTTTETTVTTEIESTTTTVSALQSTVTVYERADKRQVVYPDWPPETYKEGRVSHACKCLRRLISTPVVTSTETADRATITDATTTTDTVTSTYRSTAIVTSTVVPRRFGSEP
ncbi:hypothetical protein OQA88_8625 [Cercophora sp. LCS_1]